MIHRTCRVNYLNLKILFSDFKTGNTLHSLKIKTKKKGFHLEVSLPLLSCLHVPLSCPCKIWLYENTTTNQTFLPRFNKTAFYIYVTLHLVLLILQHILELSPGKQGASSLLRLHSTPLSGCTTVFQPTAGCACCVCPISYTWTFDSFVVWPDIWYEF